MKKIAALSAELMLLCAKWKDLYFFACAFFLLCYQLGGLFSAFFGEFAQPSEMTDRPTLAAA